MLPHSTESLNSPIKLETNCFNCFSEVAGREKARSGLFRPILAVRLENNSGKRILNPLESIIHNEVHREHNWLIV